MNIKIFTDHRKLKQIIDECEILSTQDVARVVQTLIAVHKGVDILIVTDCLSEGGMIIHPCSKDAEVGGSVHEDLRFLARQRACHQEQQEARKHARQRTRK
jgi:hypothetical protein